MKDKKRIIKLFKYLKKSYPKSNYRSHKDKIVLDLKNRYQVHYKVSKFEGEVLVIYGPTDLFHFILHTFAFKSQNYIFVKTSPIHINNIVAEIIQKIESFFTSSVNFITE